MQKCAPKTDEKLDFTYYFYDFRGRLTDKVLPDPDGPGELNPLTSPECHWTYDAASQVLNETDPLGRVTEHVRDNLGNEIQTILPDPRAIEHRGLV